MKNDLDLIISNNIKNEIVYSGKSKAKIAAELGVSRPTISQYLSGKIRPSLSTFARLCRILDSSADDILGLNDKAGRTLD